jgi:hypothetical protein
MADDYDVQNNLNSTIFFPSFIASVLLLIISIILSHYDATTPATIFLSFFSLSLGVAGSNLFEIIKYKYFKKNKKKVSCKFQLDLRDIGILQVYSTRKNTDDNGYFYDLIEEFNKIKAKNKKNKIKIIGVALESYFGILTKTLAAIKECCPLAYFQVLLSDKDNPELYNKYNLLNDTEKNINNFIKGLSEDEKNKYNSLDNEGKNRMRFEKMELIQNIGATINSLDRLCVDYNKDSESKHLDYYQYKDFSPYATVIFINDKIFYTPNMTIFESYYKENKKEDIPGIDLSFCIKSNSKAGKKLENSFDKIWAYQKNQATKTP